jgi:uncharacterized protein (TIGR02270 family)
LSEAETVVLGAAAPVIPEIVEQHLEESAHLRQVRSFLVQAPHVNLLQLGRHDERIVAHLDGLAVAGESGTRTCRAALQSPGVGEVYAAAVRSIEDQDREGLDSIIEIVSGVPESEAGLISAFGWVSAHFLQGTIKEFLASDDPLHRRLGITACAMHRVDPGARLDMAASDVDPRLRARVVRAAGECGRRDLLPACMKAHADEDRAIRFWAAWSAALLGEPHKVLPVLQAFALAASLFRDRAARILFKVEAPRRALELLRTVAQNPADIRALIQAVGIAGDPHHVPWLIEQMSDLTLARLAGESFSFITGLDLATLDLERARPEGIRLGPTDAPEDEDVAMDPDDGLPWPDPEKIQKWWETHRHDLPAGVRHFMGKPPAWEHCLDVLRNGYQRQRIAAAEYLCLLRPGTRLFNTAAPAWRQKRLLDRMT